MEITYYLQYLLIKKWIYNNKEVWGRGDNKIGGGNEAKIPAKLTAPIHYTENIDLATFLYI